MWQDPNFGGDAASEALRIEEVMIRAHEIHRARGGLIGYDLEDWLQAERELIEKNRSDNFQAEEAAHAEPLSERCGNQERNRKECFAQNN